MLFRSADDDLVLAAGDALFSVRDALNQALEPKVKAKEIGHRREVAVRLGLPGTLRAQLAPLLADAADLSELLSVAAVETIEAAALQIEVARTSDTQCQRCWRHLRDVGSVEPYADLCRRCADVVAHRALNAANAPNAS